MFKMDYNCNAEEESNNNNFFDTTYTATKKLSVENIDAD